LNPILEKEVKRKLSDLEASFTEKIDPLEVLRNGGDLNDQGGAASGSSNLTIQDSEKEEEGGGFIIACFVITFPE